ncbi:unnamed protein product [Sphagnum jensenii]|uniref:Uncharacterized protein n=1 Tax=Sphagnum jensenii TaxID=128206 RepID=A0ABP1AJZ4_9BRYO
MSGRGNFVARVVQYVVNELVVDRLANNVSFQRFAVMSSKAIEDVAQKDMILCISKVPQGLQAREELTHQLKVYSESFKEEISRSLKDINKRH